MLSRLLFLLLTSLFFSCSPEKKLPLIVFSHNLNGELQPCGCRKTPLGGMEQGISFMRQLKKENPKREILYFDTGDSFFPLGAIPKMLHESHLFSAREMASFFKEMGLIAQLPGDQEFSFGVKTYQDLLSSQGLPRPILTNYKKASVPNFQPTPSLSFVYGKKVLYILGVLRPDLTSEKILLPPETSLKKELKKISLAHEKKFPKKEKVFILLSHSGMDEDRKLAKIFPDFVWIIGAHDQRFNQIPVLEGKTSITQVLSRNHYMGLIDLETQNPKRRYRAIELNESFQKENTDQLLKKRVKDYQENLEKIQKKELGEKGELSWESST